MVTPIYAQNGRKSTKITCHGPMPTVTHNELKCGKNEDPAKITYSKMAFFSRPCFPCAHEQMQTQARARRPHEVPCGSAAATARARAATAADVAVRGSRRRCKCGAPGRCRRSPRRGRSPVGWGLDTPGARTQVAPSTAAYPVGRHTNPPNLCCHRAHFQVSRPEVLWDMP